MILLLLFLLRLLPSLFAAESAEPAPPAWRELRTVGESGLTYESACAYDARAKRLVVFGGHGYWFTGAQRNDTWLFDPGSLTWTQASPANRPPGACCTRDLVSDAAQGVTVYFGGCTYFHGWQMKSARIRGGAPPWVYDAVGDTWIPMKPTGDVPVRTAYSGLAYDSHNQVVVKYGGGGCEAYDPGGTWVYDGYANTWTKMKADPSPPIGRLPAMTYDEDHRAVLLYGSDDGRSSDLWAYDIAADAWVNRRAAAAPPAGQIIDVGWGGPVDYASFVFDRGTRMPVLFKPKGKGMGAWAYDWDRNAWRLLDARNPPPGVGLAQAAHVPERHMTVFVNGGTPGSRVRIRGTWAFLHPAGADPDRPEPPSDPVVTSGPGRAELFWTASPSTGVVKYVIYRGRGDRPWSVAYARIGETRKTRYLDRGIGPEGVYHYAVRAVDARGNESRDSVKVRTQPRAPREPWVSLLGGNGVEVTWTPSPEADVAGYHVYRGRGRPGAVVRRLNDGHAEGFVRITSSPVPGPSVTDTVEDPGGLAYLVRAVNARGTESGPSPWALTIPSEVRGLGVGVRDGKVTLTWRPGREKGLRGYNIYRIDARDDEAPEKLNAEPVTDPVFVDAGKTDGSPCRYYVAAVDARGAEGVMSFGAWAFDNGEE